MARFSNPYGIATDSNGNIYVADSFDHTLRKITPGGVVTTLAGVTGANGSTDDTGAAARFDEPEGVTIDVRGNLYVIEPKQYRIRRVTPSGVVTTVAELSAIPRPNGSLIYSQGSIYFTAQNAVWVMTNLP